MIAVRNFKREFCEFLGSTSLAISQMNRLLIQLAALVGGGYVQRSALSPSTLHARLAELVVGVEERHPLVVEHRAFSKFLTFAEVLSPLALTAILNTLIEAADEKVLVPSVFSAFAFCGEREPLYFLSDEVASLMIELAELKPTDKLHFSYASTFALLRLTANQTNLFSFQDPILTFEAVMLGVMTGANLECRRSAPTSSGGVPDTKIYDVAFAVPPVGTPYAIIEDDFVKRVDIKLPTRDLETLLFDRMLRQTKRRSVALVPLRVLFAPGKAERKIRQRLVEENFLDAVIKLPSGVISNAASDSALMVFRGAEAHSTEAPLVVDASGDEFHSSPERFDVDFPTREQMRNRARLTEIVKERRETEISKKLRREELLATDFNLMPERYNVTPETRVLRSSFASRSWSSLSSIATLSRPVAIPYFDPHALADLQFFREASIADIGPSGLLQPPMKLLPLDQRGYQKNRKVFLRPKDILLVIKGSVGKVAFVPEDLEEEWLPNQSFVVIRIHEGEKRISPEFLFRYLASPLAQQSLATLTGGNSTKVLLAGDLRHFEIPIPDEILRANIVAAHREILERFRQASELELEARSIEERMWKVA